MKYKNKKKIKRYFDYTSSILQFYFLTFCEMKYTSSILLSLNRHTFRKSTLNIYTSEFAQKYIKKKNSTSSILQSFKINTSILKVCFKYTSEFEDK